MANSVHPAVFPSVPYSIIPSCPPTNMHTWSTTTQTCKTTRPTFAEMYSDPRCHFRFRLRRSSNVHRPSLLSPPPSSHQPDTASYNSVDSPRDTGRPFRVRIGSAGGNRQRAIPNGEPSQYGVVVVLRLMHLCPRSHSYLPTRTTASGRSSSPRQTNVFRTCLLGYLIVVSGSDPVRVYVFGFWVGTRG